MSSHGTHTVWTRLGSLHRVLCMKILLIGRPYKYSRIDFTSPRAVRNSKGSVVPFSTSAAFSVGCAETAVGVTRRFPRAEVGVLAAAADRPSRWALVVTKTRLTAPDRRNAAPEEGSGRNRFRALKRFHGASQIADQFSMRKHLGKTILRT